MLGARGEVWATTRLLVARPVRFLINAARARMRLGCLRVPVLPLRRKGDRLSK